MDFPVSGVHCSPFLPPLVSFVISSVMASAGLSGAFLLLPFQMSVLGFVTPAVSPTNLIYNVVAIPGGTYRYIREGRMAWPLAWIVLIGTLPGMFLGAMVRSRYLVDPRAVKFFVGLVLLYLASRLFLAKSSSRGKQGVAQGVVKTIKISPRRVEYEFLNHTYRFRPWAVLLLGVIVGLIGGIYGIGGGAIIAPFIIAMFGLPVYTIAGATMLSTFVTSLAGVASFEYLAVRPDWALGALFGVGGLFGTYVGARLQKHLPEKWIRHFLGVVVTGLAAGYIRQFFR